MDERIKNDSVEKLFEAILTLENIEECENFFSDLCTISEIQSIAQRIEVADMLYNNNTYTKIAEKTKASTATISRVKRALNYGSEGYKVVLDKMNNEKKESQQN